MVVSSHRRAICALLLVWLASAALGAQGGTYQIDQTATSVLIQVGKGGLFSFAAHDHEVTAPAVAGSIVLDQTDVTKSKVSLEFNATALKVTGKGEPAEDVPEVQAAMLSDRVLDVRQYPTITFRSNRVSLVNKAADRLTLNVAGDLTLHGMTRPVTTRVEVSLKDPSLTATGTARIRQTDFGMKPVTVGGGTVRVKDEVDVVFRVVGRRTTG
jgi:polyisoprenoid-binding protein YceI